LDTADKQEIDDWKSSGKIFCSVDWLKRWHQYAKWISMIENVIADKISRLKKLIATNSTLFAIPSYDNANLQQEHTELKACTFFQPGSELVLLIWEILLMQNCPDLSLILSLRPQDLGKLCK
jgi:hypothetical protein